MGELCASLSTGLFGVGRLVPVRKNAELVVGVLAIFDEHYFGAAIKMASDGVGCDVHVFFV